MEVLSKTPKEAKIFISGIAGLVGQNLALRLSQAGYTQISGVDKHRANLKLLQSCQPNLTVQLADIAEMGDWSDMVKEAEVVIINQAQIGGLDYEDFHRNNVSATQNILDTINQDRNPYVVQISSSVVNSSADDFYTQSKTAQEDLVKKIGINGVILRPTLMFGWFDRKHLGWLRRFMSKTPVFPIPGSGKYRRQPLYVGDFCNIIISCIENQPKCEVYNISGREIINYIDLIKTIKAQTKEKTPILCIPYWVFFTLIWGVGLIKKNPPFTIHQLRALIIPEVFDIIDWPNIFGVSQTSFMEAVDETFNHPEYSKIVLKF
jgi:nucleoside-diphosphate-sugar epimerase